MKGPLAFRVDLREDGPANGPLDSTYSRVVDNLGINQATMRSPLSEEGKFNVNDGRHLPCAACSHPPRRVVFTRYMQCVRPLVIVEPLSRRCGPLRTRRRCRVCRRLKVHSHQQLTQLGPERSTAFNAD